MLYNLLKKLVMKVYPTNKNLFFSKRHILSTSSNSDLIMVATVLDDLVVNIPMLVNR